LAAGPLARIDLQPRRICAAGDQAFHDIKQLQEFGLAQKAKLYGVDLSLRR
jgi:hypothetical protein